MSLRTFVRNLPGRAATGVFIVHSGWQKWNGDEQTAVGIHGMASHAFPALKDIKPSTFLKLVSVGELATGAALLTPFVPRFIAGAALSGFSGALLTMYWRTPALRQEGSIWPTPAGLGVSKDVWMFGIGSGLVLDAILPVEKK